MCVRLYWEYFIESLPAACARLCSAVKKWLSWQQNTCKQVSWSLTALLLPTKTLCSVNNCFTNSSSSTGQDKCCNVCVVSGLTLQWIKSLRLSSALVYSDLCCTCRFCSSTVSVFITPSSRLALSLCWFLPVVIQLFTLLVMWDFTATKCNFWSLSSKVCCSSCPAPPPPVITHVT